MRVVYASASGVSLASAGARLLLASLETLLPSTDCRLHQRSPTYFVDGAEGEPATEVVSGVAVRLLLASNLMLYLPGVRD